MRGLSLGVALIILVIGGIVLITGLLQPRTTPAQQTISSQQNIPAIAPSPANIKTPERPIQGESPVQNPKSKIQNPDTRHPTPDTPSSQVKDSNVPYLIEGIERISLALPDLARWKSITTSDSHILADFESRESLKTTLSIAYTPIADINSLPGDFPATVAASQKKLFDSYVQIAKKRISVAGESGWQIDGQWGWKVGKPGTPGYSQGTARNRQIYVLHENHCYIFTLTTDQPMFGKFTPVMDTLITSVRWINPTGKGAGF